MLVQNFALGGDTVKVLGESLRIYGRLAGGECRRAKNNIEYALTTPILYSECDTASRSTIGSICSSCFGSPCHENCAVFT